MECSDTPLILEGNMKKFTESEALPSPFALIDRARFMFTASGSLNLTLVSKPPSTDLHVLVRRLMNNF